VSLTLRPTISALTIGYYYTLLEYCLEQKLLIKSLLVIGHEYLIAKKLPLHIRKSYVDNYEKILKKLPNIDVTKDYNESDPYNYINSVKIQIIQILNILNSQEQNSDLGDMIKHCRRWDDVTKLDARKLYPEFKELFDQYGY
jgi:hypothetical protein